MRDRQGRPTAVRHEPCRSPVALGPGGLVLTWPSPLVKRVEDPVHAVPTTGPIKRLIKRAQIPSPSPRASGRNPSQEPRSLLVQPRRASLPSRRHRLETLADGGRGGPQVSTSGHEPASQGLSRSQRGQRPSHASRTLSSISRREPPEDSDNLPDEIIDLAISPLRSVVSADTPRPPSAPFALAWRQYSSVVRCAGSWGAPIGRG